jgi:hypothetical protein
VRNSKKVTIISSGSIVLISLVFVLLSIISIISVKTNSYELTEDSKPLFVNSSLIFTSNSLFSGSQPKIKEKVILKKSNLKRDKNKLSLMEALIEKQKIHNTNKYCDTTYTSISTSSENEIKTARQIITIICVNEKNKKHLWKGGESVATFYYSRDIADSVIIGKKSIDFSTKMLNVDDSFIRFYNDSSYCF